MSGGIYGRPLYWRATMQPARMLIWDARVAPAVALAIVHFRLWTLVLLAVCLGLAALCEYRGMSIPAGFRLVRSTLAGRRRRATSRPPRRPACYAGEATGNLVWDPTTCTAVPPPSWRRRADRRTRRLARAAEAERENSDCGDRAW